MKELEVVTSFLRSRGKILILRRSSEVSTYQGKWAGVSGYIEMGDRPIIRALKEIEEEVGLDKHKVQLINEGEPLRVPDEKRGIMWIVHPFLFESKTESIKVDWEHREFKWIDPSSLSDYETVPWLKETFVRVNSKD